eukprot:TRINITY_DN22989_c0_g1_i1.p1 TRINITY_DN22989_c0_g1~~TRINITY_DN22989_c0_g1_i1.p1  ORF type:complete len:101 (-),score=12.47 TRINITY_DN22989_c0_g1_i1:71-373(-)
MCIRDRLGDQYLIRRTQDRFYTIESNMVDEAELGRLIEKAKESEHTFTLQGDLGDAHVGLTKSDLRPPHNHEKESPTIKTKHTSKSVSYTHLTLPTKRIV